MANVNFPHGLRPLGISLSGGPGTIEQHSKVVGYGTAIFVHDAINRVADGSIEASATPGTTLYSGVSLDYGKASTATDHLCLVNPDALFEAQGNGSGTLGADDMGLNANLILTAGNATTKVSKHQIAENTKDVTATLDVKLRTLLNVPENAYGANARIEIVFNRHRLAPGVAGV
jgi:hypothetical protein